MKAQRSRGARLCGNLWPSAPGFCAHHISLESPCGECEEHWHRWVEASVHGLINGIAVATNGFREAANPETLRVLINNHRLRVAEPAFPTPAPKK